MADFDEAYLITIGIEGGYDNDPEDAGGETYKGISRKYYPDWRGWVFIDSYKTQPNFPNNAYSDGTIDTMVRTFYKEHFWNLFWGDQIPD
jgi:lysozyme family protein